MEKDAKRFVVDLTNEVTQEDLVEMIDHAIACVMMLPDIGEVDTFKKDIANPLTLLHQFSYCAKMDEKRKRMDAERLLSINS